MGFYIYFPGSHKRYGKTINITIITATHISIIIIIFVIIIIPFHTANIIGFIIIILKKTYAKQLRDYENAVLQKRLDELADDEIQALMEEIEVEDSKAKFDEKPQS